VRENGERFQNIQIFKMESSKLINYWTDMCWSCPCTKVYYITSTKNILKAFPKQIRGLKPKQTYESKPDELMVWYKWNRRVFSQEPYELYCLGLLVQLWLTFFLFSKINIAASENRHVGCNSLSLCPLLVPNIFIKKQFPNNRATLASMPWLFL
jgi:hypothetical protein